MQMLSLFHCCSHKFAQFGNNCRHPFVTFVMIIFLSFWFTLGHRVVFFTGNLLTILCTRSTIISCLLIDDRDQFKTLESPPLSAQVDACEAVG